MLISSHTQRKIQLNARSRQSALKVKRINEINLHKPWFCTMVQLKPLLRIQAIGIHSFHQGHFDMQIYVNFDYPNTSFHQLLLE